MLTPKEITINYLNSVYLDRRNALRGINSEFAAEEIKEELDCLARAAKIVMESEGE